MARPQRASGEGVLEGWTGDCRRAYGRDIVRFRHRLAESGLFSDDALIALLDRHPVAQRDICTMRPGPPPGETWIAGEARGLGGEALFEALSRGALWANLRGALANDAQYRPLFESLITDFSRAMGLPILSANASVLISGPRMGVFFHCDPAETMLWHVRGAKTINLYPRSDAFIPETAIEAILLKESLSEVPWREEMRRGARRFALAPGDGLCWPLHGPHNVENGPDLNVSVTVEYSTPLSAMTNGALKINGLMRRRLGLSPSLSRRPWALRPALWAISKALDRLSGPKPSAESAHKRRFDVDLSAPDCVRWRDEGSPYARAA